MKFCPKCGTQLPDEAVFCTNCGNPINFANNDNATTVLSQDEESTSVLQEEEEGTSVLVEGFGADEEGTSILEEEPVLAEPAQPFVPAQPVAPIQPVQPIQPIQPVQPIPQVQPVIFPEQPVIANSTKADKPKKKKKKALIIVVAIVLVFAIAIGALFAVPYTRAQIVQFYCEQFGIEKTIDITDISNGEIEVYNVEAGYDESEGCYYIKGNLAYIVLSCSEDEISKNVNGYNNYINADIDIDLDSDTFFVSINDDVLPGGYEIEVEYNDEDGCYNLFTVSFSIDM